MERGRRDELPHFLKKVAEPLVHVSIYLFCLLILSCRPPLHREGAVRAGHAHLGERAGHHSAGDDARDPHCPLLGCIWPEGMCVCGCACVCGGRGGRGLLRSTLGYCFVGILLWALKTKFSVALPRRVEEEEE